MAGTPYCRKAAEVGRLLQKRDAFNVPLTQELVMALFAKVNQKRDAVATLSQRYYSSAVMAEVIHLTPANIQLIALRRNGCTLVEGKKTETIVIGY
jgi:hypothetical protein